MTDKHFIDADDHLQDAFVLALKVHESGFRPDFILALWRGGTAVGVAVQETFKSLGCDTDHIAVRTSYEGPEAYAARDKNDAPIAVHGLSYVVERVEAHHRLLIVDDVYSSGRHVRAVMEDLTRRARRNTPQDMRVATVWRRERAGVPAPDYWVHETNQWLVLPYEFSSLTPEEIRTHKGVDIFEL